MSKRYNYKYNMRGLGTPAKNQKRKPRIRKNGTYDWVTADFNYYKWLGLKDNYNNEYFWGQEWKHYMRDADYYIRKIIYDACETFGLDPVINRKKVKDGATYLEDEWELDPYDPEVLAIYQYLTSTQTARKMNRGMVHAVREPLEPYDIIQFKNNVKKDIIADLDGNKPEEG